MKVALDECVPQRLRKHLEPHEAFTVTYLGLAGTKNGALLAALAERGFDVLVTIDRGYAYEQDVRNLPVAVVLVEVGSDRPAVLLPYCPTIVKAIGGIAKGTFVRITSSD